MRRQSPDDRKQAFAGAVHAASGAAQWHIYQQWHPDFDTLDFALAWRDYRAGIALADVYFARGIPVPTVKNGIRAPEWLFR